MYPNRDKARHSHHQQLPTAVFETRELILRLWGLGIMLQLLRLCFKQLLEALVCESQQFEPVIAGAESFGVADAFVSGASSISILRILRMVVSM